MSKRLRYIPPLVSFAAVLAGVLSFLLFASCTTTPTQPVIANQVAISFTKPDTDGGPLKFTATVNFTSQAMDYYVWKFDTSSVTTMATSIAWSFANEGTHKVHLDVRRTGDNAEMCSADTVVNIITGDSTKRILPDSLAAYLLTRYTFKAQLGSLPQLKYYELAWMFDGTTFLRFNTDTMSYVFSTVGPHAVTVTRKDIVTGDPFETAATLVQVGYLPLKITPSTTSPLVLSPVDFSVTSNASGVPSTHYLWEFGDGTTVDNFMANSIPHAFYFTGNFQVKVSLFQGSLLLGADSITVNVIPSTNGFNVPSLSSFRRATAAFVNSSDFGCLGPNHAADSLTWDGVHFSFSIEHSSGKSSFDSTTLSGTSDSHSDHRHFVGSLSSSGMLVDTLDGYADNVGKSTWFNHGSSTHSSGIDSWTGLKGFSLQIMWSTADSVCYGVIGPSTSNHISVWARCDTYYSGGPTSGWEYKGTDWNSKNPMPSLRVTFYKK